MSFNTNAFIADTVRFIQQGNISRKRIKRAQHTHTQQQQQKNEKNTYKTNWYKLDEDGEKNLLRIRVTTYTDLNNQRNGIKYT